MYMYTHTHTPIPTFSCVCVPLLSLSLPPPPLSPSLALSPSLSLSLSLSHSLANIFGFSLQAVYTSSCHSSLRSVRSGPASGRSPQGRPGASHRRRWPHHDGVTRFGVEGLGDLLEGFRVQCLGHYRVEEASSGSRCEPTSLEGIATVWSSAAVRTHTSIEFCATIMLLKMRGSHIPLSRSTFPAASPPSVYVFVCVCVSVRAPGLGLCL